MRCLHKESSFIFRLCSVILVICQEPCQPRFQTCIENQSLCRKHQILKGDLFTCDFCVERESKRHNFFLYIRTYVRVFYRYGKTVQLILWVLRTFEIILSQQPKTSANKLHPADLAKDISSPALEISTYAAIAIWNPTMWWCTWGRWLHTCWHTHLTWYHKILYSALPTNPNSPIWTHDTSDLILCRMASKIKMQRTSRKLQLICTNLLTVQTTLLTTSMYWTSLWTCDKRWINSGAHAQTKPATLIAAKLIKYLRRGWLCDRTLIMLLAVGLPSKPF